MLIVKLSLCFLLTHVQVLVAIVACALLAVTAVHLPIFMAQSGQSTSGNTSSTGTLQLEEQVSRVCMLTVAYTSRVQ